ncbi:MAG: uroporphyrinogen decarboxylase family protein, partial [Thermoplasmatota archaeon]
TLDHEEPDRVPCFLALTMHGASELGMSLREYFSSGENVARGQMALHRRYGGDFLLPFFYGALELEAWGGETVFWEDGPPNSGRPPVPSLEEIDSLEPPEVASSDRLGEMLRATRILKEEVGEEVPIVGVVVSPFSLPVMQLGFDLYLELMLLHPDRFWSLMRANQEFCVEWGNRQLEEGATAICYFDPVSSATVTTLQQYRDMGKRVASSTISRTDGAVVTHFASGRCLDRLEEVRETGTVGIGVSCLESLEELKERADGLTLIGNLNGVEMRRWTPSETEGKVEEAVKTAGPGGGFVLSDNHGEIPFQVGRSTLEAIVRANRRHGTYPIG